MGCKPIGSAFAGSNPAPTTSLSREIQIQGEMIRLGALLKIAGVIESGGEARPYLARYGVLVNGEPEQRRGRQLHPGDEVRVGDETLRLVAEA
jgi:ribosome-associated protein